MSWPAATTSRTRSHEAVVAALAPLLDATLDKVGRNVTRIESPQDDGQVLGEVPRQPLGDVVMRTLALGSCASRIAS